MTNEQLQEIEDRLSKATPGPWEVVWHTSPYQDERYPPDQGFATIEHSIRSRGPEIACQSDAPKHGNVHSEANGNKADFEEYDRANFDLMAHAPTDIAALIKALKEARAKIEGFETRLLESYQKTLEVRGKLVEARGTIKRLEIEAREAGK